MWEKYFEYANIYGCDISAQTFRYNSNRININLLDLGKITSYPQLCVRSYGIVIDDASHLLDQQLLAFFYLFPYVESGGIYILEDLHTNFPPMLEKYNHGSNDTASNVLLHLAELVLNENHASHDVNHYHNIIKSFSPEIDCISFIAKSCIIIKK